MNNKGKINYFELGVILLISIELLWYLGISFGWLDNRTSLGNDALYANTALSIAKVNSLNGIQCPVNECEKGNQNCSHYSSEGYIGYFDSETNTIIGYKPKGYNSSDNPKIDNKEFVGKRGTMVIRITCKDGKIILDWVLGNND